jgi:hypothetical protein
MPVLLDARGDDADYQIHLTYPVDDIDELRKEDWEREQAKEMKRKKKNPKVEVREDWSPDRHSVKSLFKDNPKFKRKVHIVDAGKPHLIDLLDPVRF